MRLMNSEVEVDNDNEIDLTSLSMNELKEKLRANNMPTGGKKDELIQRIEGNENVEVDTYEYFDRYTSAELIQMLKKQTRDTGGNKEDLINRLLGKEPPMPKEGWLHSKDREMLIEALEKQGSNSFRFKTAEEVYLKEPYNRWPLYRFRSYFKEALILVLKDESIAAQDNRDFQALFDKNPRPKLTSNGEYIAS